MADDVPELDAVTAHQPQRQPERRVELPLVREDLRVARPHVLDADRRVVEPDGVSADDVRRDEPVDRPVTVDHEMRADAGQLAQVRRVRGERRVGGGEAVGGRVVLDDHVRVHEPPRVDAVMALGVRARLGEPRRAERDRLHDDPGARRRRVAARRCDDDQRRRRDRRRRAPQIPAAVQVLRPKRTARGLNAATKRIFAVVARRSACAADLK